MFKTTFNKCRIPLVKSVRWASVSNVRLIQSKKLIDAEIKEKYRAQLLARAAQKGLNSPEELLEEMKPTIEETKKQLNMIDPLKELEDYEQALKLKESLKKKKDIDISKRKIDGSIPDEIPYKTLDSYFVIDKIKDLNKPEIEFLWRAKFQKDEQSLAALSPSTTFKKIYENARKYPTFVLPLPRGEEIDGKTPMEMHFVQWTFVGPNTTHCIITTLAEYKLHAEFARPHTTLAFHSELSETKDIVLMQGHVDENGGVGMDEAQMLILNIQRFYGGLNTGSKSESERLELLKKFNTGDVTFSMDECVRLSQSFDN